MKINKIDHIGIAVDDLGAIRDIYENVFNFDAHFVEDVKEQKVSTVGYNLAGVNIEFLEPMSDSSPIKKFVDKRRNAMHHLALQVDDLDAALAELKSNGVVLIDETPRIGAEGKRIAFVHPKSTGGILIEMTEKLK
jgi:methylmalonyl-CoA epimerase